MINHQMIVELLKYPIITLSIFLLLLGSRLWLGLEFGVVTKLTTDGVEFTERKTDETFKALTNLEGKLNKALLEIEHLKKISPQIAESASTTQAQLLEATETVSDQTASIENLAKPSSNTVDKDLLRGFIWIGNFQNSWTKPRLAFKGSGQPIDLEPAKLQPGTEYKVLGNMVLRDGLPNNDDNYYKGRKSLGVIPRGTIVRLTTTPISFTRETKVQYWTEVEVTKSGT